MISKYAFGSPLSDSDDKHEKTDKKPKADTAGGGGAGAPKKSAEEELDDALFK
jgi:hypothetical protein